MIHGCHIMIMNSIKLKLGDIVLANVTPNGAHTGWVFRFGNNANISWEHLTPMEKTLYESRGKAIDAVMELIPEICRQHVVQIEYK